MLQRLCELLGVVQGMQWLLQQQERPSGPETGLVAAHLSAHPVDRVVLFLPT